MKTHRDIIEQWPTVKMLAEDIGAREGTVRQWQFRYSIPSNQWLNFIEAARKRKIQLKLLEFAEAERVMR